MYENDIIVLVKEGHVLTEADFRALHLRPYETEYLMIKGLMFEDNIVYLN